MRSSTHSRLTSAFRIVMFVSLCLGLLGYIVISRHWALLHDMQVLHYVSFLIDRGWAPYRQIGDMNMPGAYLAERAALKLFGNSDLGWRLYDFTLGGLLITSCTVIARRYDWLAGFAAGACFTLLHGAEGPRTAGQRDQVMAVLLVTACAFIFEAVRRRQPVLTMPFALLGAFAGAIKPTVAIFPLVVAVMAFVELRKQGQRIASYAAYAVTGAAAVVGLVLAFLLLHGSLHAFITDVTVVLPHYISLAAPTWAYMFKATLQLQVLALLAAGIAVAALRRHRPNWEEKIILVGVLFGALNFYVQRKAYPPHRYVMLAFVLLWIFLELTPALDDLGATRMVAFCACAFALAVFVVHDLRWIHSWQARDLPSEYLQRDLESIGTAKLQHEVQCLDVVDGCLTALFHEQIVQQTGATGDLLYFLPQNAPAVSRARAEYWSVLAQTPPEVFLLFNMQFSVTKSFDKISNWPQFSNLLQSQYMLAEQREFPPNHTPTSNPGSNPNYVAYRIYVRRNSPLLNTVFPK